MTKPKYALALAGGGTRGAFEVGVWKALCELGIETSAIVGTSIGAVNGAVFASGVDPTDLWTQIRANDVVDIEGDNLFSISTLISTLKRISDGGVDATAFGEFLSKHINEEKIRNSPIEYGLCTYRTDIKKSETLFIDQIPDGNLLDYILASANFPVFKRKTIDGVNYIDGGVTNNLPIDMLIDRGYDTIISVSVKGFGVLKSADKCGINIISIECRNPEVGIMEFDSEAISKSIKSGYYECMRVFGKYRGDIYSITIDTYDNARFIYGEDILKGLEEAADMCGIDKYTVYTFDELKAKVLSEYKNSKKLSFLVYAMESENPARQILDSFGRLFRAANAVVYLKKYE